MTNHPAPEPSRDLSINDQPEVIVNSDDLTPGTDNLVSTPGPRDPDMSAALVEAREQYARAIEAIGARDKQLEELAQKMEEMRLQVELMPKQAFQNQSPPVLPDGLDPEAQVTVKDLFQFAQNFAAAQQQAMEQMEVQRIRGSWGVPAPQEAEILQRFPQIATLPELQKVQAVERVYRSLYKSKAPAAAAPERPQIPAQNLSQPVVPHVEPTRPMVRDVPPSDNGLTAARAEYEAALKVINPRERAQKMRDAAEKIARLQGTSLDDISGGQWVSRG